MDVMWTILLCLTLGHHGGKAITYAEDIYLNIPAWYPLSSDYGTTPNPSLNGESALMQAILGMLSDPDTISKYEVTEPLDKKPVERDGYLYYDATSDTQQTDTQQQYPVEYYGQTPQYFSGIDYDATPSDLNTNEYFNEDIPDVEVGQGGADVVQQQQQQQQYQSRQRQQQQQQQQFQQPTERQQQQDQRQNQQQRNSNNNSNNNNSQRRFQGRNNRNNRNNNRGNNNNNNRGNNNRRGNRDRNNGYNNNNGNQNNGYYRNGNYANNNKRNFQSKPELYNRGGFVQPGDAKSGSQKKRKHKKIKDKIVTRHDGFFVEGGVQTPGTFRNQKACEDRCNLSPLCLAADYNKETYACYLHEDKACEQRMPHPKICHMSKVPCPEELTIDHERRVAIRFNSGIPYGSLFKSIKTVQGCIKKCLNMGGGVAKDTSHDHTISQSDVYQSPQICFGIDYDFGTHKCFMNLQQFFYDEHAHHVQSWCTDHHHQENPHNHVPHENVPFLHQRGVVNYIFCPSN